MIRRPVILIANLWSDRNTGDYFITRNTIRVLKRCFPQAQICLSSYFGANQLMLARRESFRILEEDHADFVGGLFPTQVGDMKRTPLQRPVFVLREIAFVVTATLLLTAIRFRAYFVKWLIPRPFRKSLSVYLSADAIVLKGGGYITSSKLTQDIVYLYRVLYPAFFAIASGKPFAFLGHSIWGVETFFGRIMLRVVTRQAALITLREMRSYENLISLGATPKNVHVLPDLAFFTSPTDIRPLPVQRRRKTVGVSVRLWGFPGGTDPIRLWRSYVDSVSQLIEHVRTRMNCNVVLIPFVNISEVRSDRDAAATRIVLRRVSPGGDVQMLSERFSIAELCGVFSEFEAFVGTRFHSVILALTFGIPVVAISYEGPKAPGILQMFGLDEFCLDINDVTPSKLLRTFCRLWEERNLKRRQILQKLQDVSSLVLEHGRLLDLVLRPDRSVQTE